MVFVVCLNLAGFIIQQSGAFMVSKELYISPLDVTNQFGLTAFWALLAGAGAIGVIGIIFRQNIFALGALLVWVVGVLLPVSQWFLIGTPVMLGVLLPTEVGYLSSVVSAFFAIIFFMFLIEIIGQRQIT